MYKNESTDNDDAENRIPDNIKYATYFNRDRDSINAALFQKTVTTMTRQELLSNAMLVFCDETKVKKIMIKLTIRRKKQKTTQ